MEHSEVELFEVKPFEVEPFEVEPFEVEGYSSLKLKFKFFLSHNILKLNHYIIYRHIYNNLLFDFVLQFYNDYPFVLKYPLN